MKTKVSPAVVGAFVLGAFALALVALLFFGGVSFFHKPQRFLVFSTTIVQGLNPGSPVKLRGVPVGRVVDLHVRYDTTAAHQSAGRRRSASSTGTSSATDKGEEIDVTQRAAVQSLIDHGLSAQLGVSGFATGPSTSTSNSSIPSRPPAEVRFLDSQYPVVPSQPSQISAALTSAIEILVTKINQIDFKGMAAELQALIADARRQVNSVDLKGLVDAVESRPAPPLEALANSPDIKQTFLTLDATLGDVRAVVGRPGPPDRRQRQGSLRHAAAGADDAAAVRRRRAHPAAISSPRRRISTTAPARPWPSWRRPPMPSQRLADFLERNPNALISGKKPPP